MSEQIFNKIHELLSKNGAKFRVIEHESARTSEEVAKIRGTKMSQGAKALVCSIKGVNEAKFREIFKDENVLDGYLLDDEKPAMKAGKIYLLAVLPADEQADLDALTKNLMVKEQALLAQMRLQRLLIAYLARFRHLAFIKICTLLWMRVC